jgi:hypothetical protein
VSELKQAEPEPEPEPESVYVAPVPFTIKVHGRKLKISAETIIKTRVHFQQITLATIVEVLEGKIRPNDRDGYIASQLKALRDSIGGKFDGTATFRQMAVYIQTGEMVGLLG